MKLAAGPNINNFAGKSLKDFRTNIVDAYTTLYYQTKVSKMFETVGIPRLWNAKVSRCGLKQ